MFDTIFGLPVHPLVVHATVVIVPAAALAVGLTAVWPRFRAWAGLMPLLLSMVALGLVPMSIQSGKSLGKRVEETPLVERHSELGESLLPWVAALTLAAAALFWLRRREARTAVRIERPAAARLVLAAVVLVAMVSVAGTAVQIARIGHSGAEAAWSEVTAK